MITARINEDFGVTSALQSKQDEVFRAAQEADASKVFEQVFTLKHGDFFNLLLPQPSLSQWLIQPLFSR